MLIVYMTSRCDNEREPSKSIDAVASLETQEARPPCGGQGFAELLAIVTNRPNQNWTIMEAERIIGSRRLDTCRHSQKISF